MKTDTELLEEAIELLTDVQANARKLKHEWSVTTYDMNRMAVWVADALLAKEAKSQDGPPAS